VFPRHSADVPGPRLFGIIHEMNEDAASDYAPHSREESVTAALLVVIPWYSGGSFTPSDARNVCSRRCELEFLMEFF
jgi:hypothetical protein